MIPSWPLLLNITGLVARSYISGGTGNGVARFAFAEHPLNLIDLLAGILHNLFYAEKHLYTYPRNRLGNGKTPLGRRYYELG